MQSTRKSIEMPPTNRELFVRRRIVFPIAIAAAAVCAALSGCSSSSGDSGVVTAASAPAQPGATMEVQIEGIGTKGQAARAVWLESGTAGSGDAAAATGAANPATKNTSALSAVTGGMDIKPLSTSTTDRDGFRYISASFQVRNAVACGTAGSCAVHAVQRRNVTFMGGIPAAQLPGGTSPSPNPSPFVSVLRYDGSPADPLLVPALKPAHGVDGVGDVQPGLASLQVFNESEVPAPTGTVVGALVPYGFVVRNVNDNSRLLPASPAVNQFDGLVTFAFRFPIQPNPADNPFKISILVQAKEDVNTRTTQSLQEQSFAGDGNATVRELLLGSNDLAVLGGRVAQTIIGNPICQVRATGTAASPTSFLVNQIPSPPSVQAAPMNLEGVFPFSDIVLGFCEPMATPTQSTLWVHGSMSGLRRVGAFYGGTPNGGNATAQRNQLIWNVFGYQPFFANETVQFTATAGNLNQLGTPITPFVGRYRVRGNSVASSGTFNPLSTDNLPMGSGALASELNGAVLADVNGDGRLDVIATHPVGDVLIRLGTAGGFGASSAYPAGGNSQSANVGDVNGDGRPDIVLGNRDGFSGGIHVTVLLGTGTGSFGSATFNFAGFGSGRVSVATGDVNADGRLDAVVANASQNTVSVLLGNGAGGFGAPASIPVGVNPMAIALGDLNNDGRLDIVAANAGSNSVSVLLGTGGGSFSAATSLSVGTSPSSVSVGDVNGDGVLDIVAANSGSNNVSVALGTGAGGFAAASNYAVGTNPSSVALGDLNGDGRLDLVVANSDSGTSSVLLGLGNGSFGVAANVSLGLLPPPTAAPASVVLADVNVDGKLDAIFAVSNYANVVVVQYGQ